MTAPVDQADFAPPHTPFPEHHPLLPSRRGDGWSGDRQRDFCEMLAHGTTVEGACRALGLSVASAYAYRTSARGAAFAIGWAAALLLQRHRLADDLAQRALEGQVVTLTHADGTQSERHAYDNRLALAVLARLDRLAATLAPTAHAPAPAGEAHAARLAAGEFDRYLDLLAADAGPARAGLFLALRTADAPATADLAAITGLARADLYLRTHAGVPAEIATADLDVAARATWTAEQWARAEAAGLLALAVPAAAPAPEAAPEYAEDPVAPQHPQHSATIDDLSDALGDRVWEDEEAGWMTDFPPPAGFDGTERGRYGGDDYARTLGDDEAMALDICLEDFRDDLARADEPARVAWLADLAAAASRAHADSAAAPA